MPSETHNTAQDYMGYASIAGSIAGPVTGALFSESATSLAAEDHSGLTRAMAAMTGEKLDAFKAAELSGSEAGFGVASGTISAVGSGLSLASNSLGAHAQRKKGDRAGTWGHALAGAGDAVGVLSGVGKAATYGASIGSTAAPAVELFGNSIAPGLGIAAGALKTGSGAVKWASASSTMEAMEKRKSGLEGKDSLDRNDTRMMRTFDQAREAAKIRRMEGRADTVAGVGGMIGSGMMFAGAAGMGIPALVGAGISGVSAGGAGVYKAIQGKRMAGKMRDGVLSQEMDVESKIDAFLQTQQAQEQGLSRNEAKRVVLKSMGVESGKRTDAFTRITYNRAKMLHDRSKGEGPEADEARAVLKDMGLKRKKGEYQMQGIVEKLGMSKDGYQTQLMEGYQRDNPFARAAAEETASKDKEAAKKKKKEMKKLRKKLEKKGVTGR